MNSDIQPYNYPKRLQEGDDETKIKVSKLIYTWRVEMKQNKVI